MNMELNRDLRSSREELEERIRATRLVRLKEHSYYVKALYDLDYGWLDKSLKKYEISQNLLREFSKFGKVERVYKYIPAFSLKLEPDQTDAFQAYVKAPEMDEILAWVEHDQLISIPEPREVTCPAEKRWNLELVQAYRAWQFSRGSGVTVAVVDTGADYEHPEIEENFLKHSKGYNVLEDSDDPMDDNNHGTHCAGIVAGKSVGVAPRVTLKAVKFLNWWGAGTLADAIRAIEWCIEARVNITSNSWGSSWYSKALEEVFDAAWERSIINVAAAGNSGRKSILYPAYYESVISVPAVDKNEKRPDWSTSNDRTEIAAPGVEIYSCIIGGKYAIYSGTSMACPHVAGGAAIIKSFYRATSERVRRNLRRHAKPLGEGKPNEDYGYGLLQIYDTLMRFY